MLTCMLVLAVVMVCMCFAQAGKAASTPRLTTVLAEMPEELRPQADEDKKQAASRNTWLKKNILGQTLSIDGKLRAVGGESNRWRLFLRDAKLDIPGMKLVIGGTISARAAPGIDALPEDTDVEFTAKIEYIEFELPKSRVFVVIDGAKWLSPRRPSLPQVPRICLLQGRWMPAEKRNVDIGATRVGGLPDMPSNVKWPVNYRREKLHFIAQIDLSTLPEIPERPLPPKGWLYFFIENDGNSFPIPVHVFHANGNPIDLQRASKPEENEFATSDDPPIFDLLPIKEAKQIASKASSPAKSVASIFGSTMIGPQTVSAWVNEYARRKGDDWVVFLRLSSVGSMLWGDSGQLQIFIRQSDLVRSDFSNCCATIESG